MSISGGVSGVGRPDLPPDGDAPAPPPPPGPGAPPSPPPASRIPSTSFAADALRRRLDERFNVTPAPAPVPVPVTDGLRGEWNAAVISALNRLERVDLADEAERALAKLFERQLRKAAGDEVPQDIIETVARQLASAARQSHLTFGLVDGVADVFEEFLVDVGRYLGAKVTFVQLEDRIRADIRARGGLNPGEDKIINDTVIHPRAHALVVEAERIKAKAYFRPGIRFDFKEIFKEPERFLREISLETGLHFDRDDFATRVGARVEVHDPIAPDADVRITGYAEVRRGAFEGRVEGTAHVESIWNDPRTGPTADLSVNLRYADPNLPVAARLGGTVRVPIRPDGRLSWEAAAGVDMRLSDRATLFGSGTIGSAPGGGRPDMGLLFGLEVEW